MTREEAIYQLEDLKKEAMSHFWCGSLSAHFDDKQLKQIAYHLVKAGLQSKNASDETQAELRKLIQFANGFHRAEKCGLIKDVQKQATSKQADAIAVMGKG